MDEALYQDTWWDSDLFKIVTAFGVSLLVLLIIYTSSVICGDCPGGILQAAPSANVNESNPDAGNGFQESADYDWIRGPHTWNVPENNQSPINIDTRCLEQTYFDTPLLWSAYDVMPLGIRLENNGNSLVLRAAFDGPSPSISGGDLLGAFYLWEITFRWSWFSSGGSEHTIDHRHYALEMQCLHTDADSEHVASSQGILMISYLFELSVENPFLDVLLQHLVAVQQAGQTVEVPGFPLNYLMSAFHNMFYSYHGSLTEPPCHRGAEWLINPVSLAISERQLNEFRQLRNSSGGRIGTNARPVQPLDDRTVYQNQYRSSSSEI